MLNIFNTKPAAQTAKDYDYNYKKESDRLEAVANDTLPNWERYYAICSNWGELKETIDGKWTYQVCPVSDKTYSTIEYSTDLFPQEENENI